MLFPKFCIQVGTRAKETYGMLKNALWDEILIHSQFFIDFHPLNIAKDDAHFSHPSTLHSGESATHFYDRICGDRHTMICELKVKLHLLQKMFNTFN
jgi:hypothetical protein